MSEPHSPSAEFQHEDAPSYSPRRPSRNRRGRSRTPRSLSASEEEEENYDYPPRRRRKPQNKGALPAVDELQDTVGGVTQTATGAVGNVAGAVSGGGGKKQEDTLSLRLDLNLDVYVKLTAKIHGDLTLSLFE